MNSSGQDCRIFAIGADARDLEQTQLVDLGLQPDRQGARVSACDLVRYLDDRLERRKCVKLVLTPNDDVARVAPAPAPGMIGLEAYRPIRTESKRSIGDLKLLPPVGRLAGERRPARDRLAAAMSVAGSLMHFQENRMGSSRRNPSRFVVKKSPKSCRSTRDSETWFHGFQKERRKVSSPFPDLLANSLMQQLRTERAAVEENGIARGRSLRKAARCRVTALSEA